MKTKSPYFQLKSKGGITGRYRFITTDAVTGEVKRVSGWSKNLVVKNDTNGVNIIARILSNDNTYSLPISGCGIGTGTNAPADGDTDLQTLTIRKESVANVTLTAVNVVLLAFFLNTTELANGTYKEFCIYCNGTGATRKLFARSLITPNYTKGTNENTTIEYEITISNT